MITITIVFVLLGFIALPLGMAIRWAAWNGLFFSYGHFIDMDPNQAMLLIIFITLEITYVFLKRLV